VVPPSLFFVVAESRSKARFSRVVLFLLLVSPTKRRGADRAPNKANGFDLLSAAAAVPPISLLDEPAVAAEEDSGFFGRGGAWGGGCGTTAAGAASGGFIFERKNDTITCFIWFHISTVKSKSFISWSMYAMVFWLPTMTRTNSITSGSYALPMAGRSVCRNSSNSATSSLQFIKSVSSSSCPPDDDITIVQHNELPHHPCCRSFRKRHLLGGRGWSKRVCFLT
jgi:hypothetical protein